MTKIRITMTVDEEYSDPDHEMGITEAGYEEMMEALTSFGEDIDIRKEV